MVLMRKQKELVLAEPRKRPCSGNVHSKAL